MVALGEYAQDVSNPEPGNLALSAIVIFATGVWWDCCVTIVIINPNYWEINSNGKM